MCLIHFYVEQMVEGEWTMAREEAPFGSCWLAMFLNQEIPARGFPDDLSKEVARRKAAIPKWQYRNPSYWNLKELLRREEAIRSCSPDVTDSVDFAISLLPDGGDARTIRLVYWLS